MQGKPIQQTMNTGSLRWTSVPQRGTGARLGRPARGSQLIPRYSHGENPTCDPSTYLSLGVATCFEKTKEGKLAEKDVIEPIGAPSLECLANGAATSFKVVTGVTLAEALQRDRMVLPEEFSSALFCEDFAYRCNAAARTWTRSHAQDNLMDIVPLGQVKSNFNFDLGYKRVLNFENIVDDDDNIKQDMSIDVYGRKKDEEYADSHAEDIKKVEDKPTQTQMTVEEEEEEEEEEDDLDSLLMG